MIDFICIGLVELQGTESKRELQNEKFLPRKDQSQKPSAYQYYFCLVNTVPKLLSKLYILWINLKYNFNTFINVFPTCENGDPLSEILL